MVTFRKFLFHFSIGLCLVMMFCGRVCATEQYSDDTNGQAATEQTATEQTASRIVKSLEQPEITSLVSTEKGAIKLQWKAVPDTDYYEVYRQPEKGGDYKLLGTTKKLKYTDESGKQYKTYYYKIRAVKPAEQENITYVSPLSAREKGYVRKAAKKTAYVGDSVMTGFRSYGVIKDSKSQKMFAEVGINTGKFYYDSPLMGKLLNYNPDRMFIMLGVNGLVGNPGEGHMDRIIGSYDKILAACQKKNPHMEIIVLGVSPVSSRATVKESSVKKYNQKLKKKVTRRKNVYFYDMAEFMADSHGYLKSQYASGDGIHWRSSAYKDVYKHLKKIAKEL